VLDGELIRYGADLRWCYHRISYCVGKILRGMLVGRLVARRG